MYESISTWPDRLSKPSGARYAPVASHGGAPSRTLPKFGHKTSQGSLLRQTVHESIDEGDEYDMSLLRSAAPIGEDPRYEAVAEEGPAQEGEPAAPVFDVTSALGPMSLQDGDFVSRLQQQEARGNLTGGLGQGFRPASRVKDSDLLSPVSPLRSVSKSFSFHKASRPLKRAETIRLMAQDEANRRREVIEVILEEPAGADLSTVEGSAGVKTDGDARRAAFTREQKTRTFYPQPNWKPLSMRWPYLAMLIVVSVALAVMQEVLFRKYLHTPVMRFQSPNEVDPGMYFVVKFVPTLAAVVYGVLWQFTDFEVRRLEAYYQLSKPGGALAAESINVDYVTSFNFFRPIRALRLGHYAVAFSSIATTLAASLVPTCAAASLVLSPDRQQRMEHPLGFKELHFASAWSRALTSTLAVCAVAGCGLMYTLQSRRSGLLSDVRGIAGLASMAVVSHILMDFKGMDQAKHKEIHKSLKEHRYTLRNCSLAPDDDNPVSSKDLNKFEDSHVSENPHPLMLRPAGIIPFIIAMLLFLGFIPTFLFTSADVVTISAPWVVTALAVCVKLTWNSLETAVRMMEPFYILSRRHAPARTLSLDYSALPFGYMPLVASFNGHFLVFLVGFGSIMAEFFTILVTGLSSVDGRDFLADWADKKHANTGTPISSGTETVKSFYVSFALSVFILLYMSTVAGLVFMRRRHPFLPRQPSTIASVLAYIHQSKMLYDFVGKDRLSISELVRRLEDGKTYGLGWFQGRDGQTHCGVDQEELVSYYKHGINFPDGNMPWTTQWDVL